MENLSGLSNRCENLRGDFQHSPNLSLEVVAEAAAAGRAIALQRRTVSYIVLKCPPRRTGRTQVYAGRESACGYHGLHTVSLQLGSEFSGGCMQRRDFLKGAASL